MFTGIIETLGEIVAINEQNTNKHFIIKADFISELKVDQSVAHNGVCLTVINIESNTYTVTAIQETLDRTALNNLKVGDKVNLERCMKADGRLDGHIVQGHVDQKARVKQISDLDGSWKYFFDFQQTPQNITVEKGSVCIDGVSLTVVDSLKNGFSVVIIPYTFEHTRFGKYKPGTEVNIEFDIIGKYIQKLASKTNL